jgi:hypothetical protein
MRRQPDADRGTFWSDLDFVLDAYRSVSADYARKAIRASELTCSAASCIGSRSPVHRAWVKIVEGSVHGRRIPPVQAADWDFRRLPASAVTRCGLGGQWSPAVTQVADACGDEVVRRCRVQPPGQRCRSSSRRSPAPSLIWRGRGVAGSIACRRLPNAGRSGCPGRSRSSRPVLGRSVCPPVAVGESPVGRGAPECVVGAVFLGVDGDGAQ